MLTVAERVGPIVEAHRLEMRDFALVMLRRAIHGRHPRDANHYRIELLQEWAARLNGVQ